MGYQVPRMSPLESRAWLALIATTQLLPNALEAQLLADSKITHFEFMALGVLNLAPDRTMQMKQLAAATNSQLPRLSKVVTRLESRGLVERLACPGDARATNVHLTQEGRRLVKLATPGHLATVRELVIDRLSDEQLAGLADALEGVVAHLDPDTRSGPASVEHLGRA
jgi:DNA-binding MarR family transcriptional regulator